MPLTPKGGLIMFYSYRVPNISSLFNFIGVALFNGIILFNFYLSVYCWSGDQ